MMRTYGQYCPLARASELLAERWTLIIVRNLLAGCRTFGELLEGAPGISRALLAQRLALLEQYEVVVRETAAWPAVRYALTERGRELRAVVQVMGEWGARWLELEPHHTDPAYVLFATSRLVDVERAPAHGLVVRFELGDRHYWLLVRRRAPRCARRTLAARRISSCARTARCSPAATSATRRSPRPSGAANWRSRDPGPPCARSWSVSGRARSPSRSERGGVVIEEQPRDQLAA